jgi:peroxiredoxin
MLTPGDTAPAFTLPTFDGGTFTLNDERQHSAYTLLIFLRHLG